MDIPWVELGLTAIGTLGTVTGAILYKNPLVALTRVIKSVITTDNGLLYTMGFTVRGKFDRWLIKKYGATKAPGLENDFQEGFTSLYKGFMDGDVS